VFKIEEFVVSILKDDEMKAIAKTISKQIMKNFIEKCPFFIYLLR